MFNLFAEDGALSAVGDVVLVRRFGAAGTPYNFELFEGGAFKPGGGSWGVVSDLRLKKNVTDLEGSLAKLLRLRPVSFEFKNPGQGFQLPGVQSGLIAQEVEKVFPQWVTEIAGGYKAISIKGFEALAIQALRELRDEKNAEIAELEARLVLLEQRLAER